MTSMDNLLNVWFLTYYCVILTRFNELYSKEKAARLDEIRVENNVIITEYEWTKSIHKIVSFIITFKNVEPSLFS